MGRGGGGGSRGGGGRSGGSRGGSFRSSSSGGRSRSSGSFSGSSYHSTSFNHHHHTGPYYPYSRTYHSGGFSAIISVILTLVIVALVVSSVSSGGTAGDITRSTISRERLDGRYVNLSREWYDDSSMGWIRSGSRLESGLKDFYNETGVQPYLVIVSDIDGNTDPTGQEVWDYADRIYSEKFDDEGHMVFVFQCQDNSSEYMMAACTGVQAKVVLDEEEALEILYDYIDYYFYSDLDEDEMFAQAFSDAAQRIMTKQVPTGQVVAVVFGVIAAGVIVLLVIKSIHKRAKEKAEERERILKTPVSKFGSADLDDLKNKYQ